MKKILTLLLLCVGFAFSSCQKDRTVVAPNNNITIPFTIKSSTGWILNDSGDAYISKLDVPELNDYALDHDAVLVYISVDGGDSYDQVPEVYNNTSFSFTHEKGRVTLFAQTANGSAPVVPSDNLTVKVVLVDSSY